MSARDDAVGAARERAERARALVEAGAYLVAATSVLVYSDAPDVAGGGWTVDESGCGCPDKVKGQAARLGIPCKHKLAARYALAARRLEEIEKEFAR